MLRPIDDVWLSTEAVSHIKQGAQLVGSLIAAHGVEPDAIGDESVFESDDGSLVVCVFIGSASRGGTLLEYATIPVGHWAWRADGHR